MRVAQHNEVNDVARSEDGRSGYDNKVDVLKKVGTNTDTHNAAALFGVHSRSLSKAGSGRRPNTRQ